MKVFIAGLTLVGFITMESPQETHPKSTALNRVLAHDDLKLDAFEVLDTKCNVCHKKKNPLMVFSLKNIEKRASKIYKQVFVKRRMPKGNQVRLTTEEYVRLEQWLSTQNIK